MELIKNTEITINNVTFDIKTNVKDIFTDIHTGNKTYTFYEEPIDKDNLKIFFLFEAPFHEAFCHWVFESAIFLPFVKNFTSYDNFFILVNKNNERKYKKSFFKLFNINDKNIQYIDNLETHTDNVSYKNIQKNNISIVCRNFILNQIPSSLNKDLDNRQGNCIKQETIYLKKSHLRFSELLYKLYHSGLRSLIIQLLFVLLLSFRIHR